jgi:hypothetical protein
LSFIDNILIAVALLALLTLTSTATHLPAVLLILSGLVSAVKEWAERG